jgi:hypothetical protein
MLAGPVSAPMGCSTMAARSWVGVTDSGPAERSSARVSVIARSSASTASLIVTSFWFWDAATWAIARFGLGIR